MTVANTLQRSFDRGNKYVDIQFSVLIFHLSRITMSKTDTESWKNGYTQSRSQRRDSKKIRRRNGTEVIWKEVLFPETIDKKGI